MKIKQRVIVVFLTGCLVIMTILSFVPDSSNKVLAKLNDSGIFPESVLLSYNDSLKIHLMKLGDSTLKPLLLIHGSPGDWSAWENIILNDSIRESYQILAIDRAGYSNTTVPAKSKLSEQANVIWHVIKKLEINSNITIVGHSYGGAVVEQLLIDQPQAFSKAIMVAPTLSPELSEPRWYNKVASWKIIDKMLSEDLRASNKEMLGLPESLMLNHDKLILIATPIVYIQGMEDVLVPYETVDYFKKYKPNGVEYIIIEDMNHFTPWSDPILITDAILGKAKGHINN